MTHDDILTEVENLLEDIVISRNLELVDLSFVREGKNYYLRVYVDKAGGIDLDEISKVSELLSEKLDEANLIETAYYLDVSSPGAERPLKKKEDFQKSIGKYVSVSLDHHIDGASEYVGTLIDFADDIVTLEYQYKHTKKQVNIPYDKIAKARLAVKL